MSFENLTLAINRSISFADLSSSSYTNQNTEPIIDFDSDDLIVKITEKEFMNSRPSSNEMNILEQAACAKMKRIRSQVIRNDDEKQFSQFETTVNRELYQQYYSSEGKLDFLLLHLITMMKLGMSYNEMEQQWNTMIIRGPYVMKGSFKPSLNKLSTSPAFKEWTENEELKEFLSRKWKPSSQPQMHHPTMTDKNVVSDRALVLELNSDKTHISKAAAVHPPAEHSRNTIQEQPKSKLPSSHNHRYSSDNIYVPNERSSFSFDLSKLQDVQDLKQQRVHFKKYKDGVGYLLVCKNTFHDDDIKDRFCMRMETVDALKQQFGDNLPDVVSGIVTQARVVDSSLRLGMRKDSKMVSLTVKDFTKV